MSCGPRSICCGRCRSSHGGGGSAGHAGCRRGPRGRVGGAVGDEAIKSSGVQRNSDAPTPVVRIEVERVQVTHVDRRGRWRPGWAGRSESTTCPSSVATTTLVRSSWVVIRSDQSCSRPVPTGLEHLVGHQASVARRAGRDMHGGEGVSVGRRRVPEFDHVPMLAVSPGTAPRQSGEQAPPAASARRQEGPACIAGQQQACQHHLRRRPLSSGSSRHPAAKEGTRRGDANAIGGA